MRSTATTSDIVINSAESESGFGLDAGFDLIVTATYPDRVPWLARLRWASWLTNRGTLAVFTHDANVVHHRGAVSNIANALSGRRLGWFEHIAVLCERVPGQPSTVYGTEPLVVHRAHHDLLIFEPVAPSEESSDD